MISAEIVTVTADEAGQRLDNFLLKKIKGVPHTRIYRAVRGGEVRVGGGRKSVSHKLSCGDRVRIPPLRRGLAAEMKAARNLESAQKFRAQIAALYEDDDVLAVNKPAGLASHGGGGLAFGLIEIMRAERPRLELAHRLDRDTSGCLLLAKSRAALMGIQLQMRERRVDKEYLAVASGRWTGGAREVDIPLPNRKSSAAKNSAPQSPDANTKTIDARSIFTPLQVFEECALLRIQLITGRMHQARLHAAGIGHPLLGDRIYGDAEGARLAEAVNLNRLFLHAERLRLQQPLTAEPLEIRAPLPAELAAALQNF